MMERDRAQLLQGLEAARALGNDGLEAAKTLGKELASALADKLAAAAAQPRERRRKPAKGARPTQTAADADGGPPRPAPVRPQPAAGDGAEQSAPSGGRPPAGLQEAGDAREEEPARVRDSLPTMLSEGEVSEGEVPTVATGDGGSPSARSRTHAAEMGGDAPLADGAAMSDGEVSRGAPRRR